ncbi:hypothetical protein [Granulicella sp. L46]|jgi:hypothetical protein|uniref:hypothetical protein n=1 Tax=Granulicella sp. L46 TaxID=1641865 RepID=UPI00131D1E31|nr:hypothetical protein [Granulicella sp. L46]
MTSSTKGAIIGGCLGIVLMLVMIESNVEATGLWLVLWPSAMFGSIHGQGGGIFCLVVGSIEVGLQFLAYAALGWMVGAVVRIARKEG